MGDASALADFLERSAGAGDGGVVNARYALNVEGEFTTLLIESAKLRSLESMGMLLEAGAIVDAKDWQGATACVWSAFRGWPAGLEALLIHGADPFACESKSAAKRSAWLLCKLTRQPRCAALLELAMEFQRPDDWSARGAIDKVDRAYAADLDREKELMRAGMWAGMERSALARCAKGAVSAQTPAKRI